MSAIGKIEKKTGSKFLSYYEMEAIHRDGSVSPYYMASRIGDPGKLKAVTHRNDPDGVILCGCHPGDCHYTTGNYFTRRRMTLLLGMLNYLGVAGDRFRVEWVSAAEGARFAQVMNDFAEHIASLGENVKLRDLRCAK